MLIQTLHRKKTRKKNLLKKEIEKKRNREIEKKKHTKTVRYVH